MGVNTETVIKALECCFSNGSCDGCPYTERVDCRRELERNALALIKQQQAEIEEWQERYLENFKETFPLAIENELLRRKIKYLDIRLKEEMEIKEDMKGK